MYLVIPMRDASEEDTCRKMNVSQKKGKRKEIDAVVFMDYYILRSSTQFVSIGSNIKLYLLPHLDSQNSYCCYAAFSIC